MNDLSDKIATAEELGRWMDDARAHTLGLVEDLEEGTLLGPQVDTINPFIWHLGHTNFFHELWVLRNLYDLEPFLPHADILYDSFEVAHETRWGLEMPDQQGTLDYLNRVLAAEKECLSKGPPGEELTYFIRTSVFHEDMHGEAMTYDRQTVAYPPPVFLKPKPVPGGGPLKGDVEIPGNSAFLLGGSPHQPYVFDNEKWGHPVAVKPFKMARAPVTNGEFAQFVEAGGYENPDYWSLWGQLWLSKTKPKHPIYWRKGAGNGWEVRVYDQWTPLKEHQPVMNVGWHEAEAWCNWAGRRLPTEAEWELAASTGPNEAGGTQGEKTRFPWGNTLPTPSQANMDCYYGGVAEVGAFPDGDTPHGLRQMMGNVWEWTADPFFPFPGFVVDPYKEYSAPWFGYQKVLKGGSWATRSRMVRSTWRNFFMPQRTDVFTGFRTCAP